MKVLTFLLLIPLLAYSEPHTPADAAHPASARPTVETTELKGFGIRFSCTKEENHQLQWDMVTLLKELRLQGKGFVTRQQSADGKILEYSLASKDGETDTFNIRDNPLYGIKDVSETYQNQKGQSQTIKFASQSEIILSLMQRGRMTEFKGKSCTIQALRDHLGMRQNISRWGARAWFTFPEENGIKRNIEFWDKDEWVVKPGKSPLDAIQDAFTGKLQYAIACTKAVQLIMAQGILDFQRNIKKDAPLVKELEKKLGNEPVSNRMAPYRSDEGTLVDRQYDVPWNNWAPGDWGWIKNDDEISALGFGYEGCNIVYIGGGYFGVYYDDDADRTADQALLRVYHWRDLARREKISDEELLKRLRKDPYDGGGLLRNVRDVPKRFE